MTHNLLLQNLENAIDDLSAVPLWGSPPSFPLDDFANALCETFEQDVLHLKLDKTDWSPRPLEGMGETPFMRPFVLSPLPGEFFFVMAENGLQKLAIQLLSKEEGGKGFSEDPLLRGFIDVALLNVCQAFNQLNPFGNLSACFAEEAPLPEDGALCMDLSIEINSKTFKGRIIAPRESITGFRSYFEMERPPFVIDASNADLPISLWYEAGNTQLSAQEWKETKQGDCVLLDRCTINLKEKKGTAILSAGGTPLFDIRIKGDEAKILDYAMTQKEYPMTDESSEIPLEETAELPEESEAKSLPADQIPLTLTVELGRFQMPLEKVSQLKPGNVLDLHKSTGSHVHLTIGGKRVAMGELVTLGEAIGVKILKLGD